MKSRYQILYDEFCSAAGTPSQQLEENPDGLTAFSAEMLGVAVNVLHIADSHPDSAFVLVDFGPPPEERQAEVLQRLLMTNFTMLGEETTSAFSIHPMHGNVTLQAVYPFTERSGEQLLRSVRALVNLALQWRETYFLEDVVAAEGGA